MRMVVLVGVSNFQMTMVMANGPMLTKAEMEARLSFANNFLKNVPIAFKIVPMD